MIPLIDIAALVARDADGSRSVGEQIDRACREHGFFAVTGHGVPRELAMRLDRLAREFFARPESEKASISMDRAGRAWRGWFPVGGELTSGRPDRKEGLYVGAEHSPDHPRVLDRTPLHGANLFPAHPADLGPTIVEWMAAMAVLGHTLMQGVALGLDLPATHFDRDLLADPTLLFRIFHYPPGGDTAPPDGDTAWGVGEHTDYGLLTILMQDDCGGLQVHAPGGWIDVDPVEDAFVCNIGDMLDRMTGGRYRSTAHRVRNVSGRDRLSYPFFFDPGWDAVVQPLPLAGEPPTDDARRRWDHADVHAWEGPYGQYLLGKVAKVFPDLHDTTLD